MKTRTKLARDPLGMARKLANKSGTSIIEYSLDSPSLRHLEGRRQMTIECELLLEYILSVLLKSARV